MSNPLVKLQGLRVEIAKMPKEEKQAFHAAKKAIAVVRDEHGEWSQLACLEAALEDAVKRGDM
ncbi:hypothetical protein VPHK459_0077 [Vibrio phage K459]